MAAGLALFHSEQLPPVVREELQQLIASIQEQLSKPIKYSMIKVQRVEITYAAGATTASATLPEAVTDLSRTRFEILGEMIDSASFGTSHYGLTSRINATDTTRAIVKIARYSGESSPGSGNLVAGTVTVQVTEEFTATESI